VASCPQIKAALQAYVDDELSPSERVIVEQHIGECSRCKRSAQEHQKTSADLFEHYRDSRMRRSIRSDVLRHLPEMDTTVIELKAVNYRAKHSRTRLQRLTQYAPILAASIVLVLAAIIYVYYPRESQPAMGEFGIVSHASGDVEYIAAESATSSRAETMAFVGSDGTYRTGTDSKLMLSLAHETTVKVSENTRIKVHDDRYIRLEQGRVWLDVGKDRRLFKVNTEDALITVHGTAFEVYRLPDRTVVTVERGKVMVENKFDRSKFHTVEPGEQVRVSNNDGPGRAAQVDTERHMGWTREFTADRRALELYAQHFGAAPALVQEQGLPLFLSRSPGMSGVRVAWDVDQARSNLCAYNVYISSMEGEPLFSHRIEDTVFENRMVTEDDRVVYDIPVEPKVLQDAGIITVKLVPDYSGGDRQPKGLDVLFLVLPE